MKSADKMRQISDAAASTNLVEKYKAAFDNAVTKIKYAAENGRRETTIYEWVSCNDWEDSIKIVDMLREELEKKKYKISTERHMQKTT